MQISFNFRWLQSAVALFVPVTCFILILTEKYSLLCY